MTVYNLIRKKKSVYHIATILFTPLSLSLSTYIYIYKTIADHDIYTYHGEYDRKKLLLHQSGVNTKIRKTILNY